MQLMSEKIVAYSFIRLVHEKFEDMLEKIKEIPQIVHYSVVTGEYDGILEIQVNTMSEYYEIYKKIDKIPGIVSTNTHIVMKRFDFT
jgi:DNA-binding Lrp family transcriptional regulator